jgi:glycosyltransferase involved in cell wall biosynthesis
VAGATVLRDRLALVADTLAADAGRVDVHPPGAVRSRSGAGFVRLASLIDPADRAHIWLTLAVLEGKLPDSAEVVAAARAAELDGVEAWLRSLVAASAVNGLAERRSVTVVTGRVLVDVHHTAQTDFATGIQRVTREATRRWVADHDVLLVGWVPEMTAIRALTPAESDRARHGGPPVAVPVADPIVVPWRCTYLLPELAAEVVRTAYLQALAQFSGSTFGLIGYDLVPITTAETSHEGMAPGFTRNLAAARYARVVAPISHGAAGEYLGWRDRLAGTGLSGPRIEPVVLPSYAPGDDPNQTARAAERLTLGGAPLVLVVGSHEPRKNHVAVLHAAERLWREGLVFTLTFIGGNSWNSEAFTEALQRLQEAGRPVETISAATDELLFGGYRTARFTVFPSVNEGFGLPVAESLACGTPVITSNFGAMKEIADAGGGALLVDPRDDDSVTDGMRALLTDDELLARLTAEARARPVGSWDDYAKDTWAILTAG